MAYGLLGHAVEGKIPSVEASAHTALDLHIEVLPVAIWPVKRRQLEPPPEGPANDGNAARDADPSHNSCARMRCRPNSHRLGNIIHKRWAERLAVVWVVVPKGGEA